MERSIETRHWRRGFAAGVAALALAVGGQLATRTAEERTACPLSAEPSLAQQVLQRIKPAVSAQGLPQRVALAVLGAMLGSSCS